MRVLLFSVNLTVLGAMNEFMPPASVVVLEERGVLDARDRLLAHRTGMSSRLTGHDGDHRCVEKIVFGNYVQSEEFLDVVLAEHAKRPFTAVIPGGEYTVAAAAFVAERLGLPGAGAAVAPLFGDKIALREAIDRAGLPAPRWAEVDGAEDVARFVAGAAGGSVLKPADRAGSQGIQLLDQDSDLEQAWAHAVVGDESDPSVPARPLRRRFLIEQRMRGPEYTVGLLVRDGDVVFHHIGETLLFPGPHPLERGHTFPAPISAEVQAELLSVMRRLVAGIGLHTAILIADCIVTAAGPMVVDCAARPPGASFMFLVGLAYRVNITKALVSMLSGEPVSMPSRPTGAAALRFCSGLPGVVTEISGVAEARRVPGVVGVGIETRVGDVMVPLTSSTARKAYVIAVGENPASAGSAAERGAAMVRIHTRPSANLVP